VRDRRPLLVEPGVVDGERRAGSEIFGDAQVVCLVSTSGARHREADGAERAAARDQRHDHQRSEIEAAQHLEVVRRPGDTGHDVVGHGGP